MLAKTTLMAVKTLQGTTFTKTSLTSNQVGIVHGFRSGLEATIADQLRATGTPVVFEEFHIPWQLSKSCKYTPDFVLPNGIIIESKGRFVTQDRQKHIYIREQHPHLDIRFVFSRSASRISKASKTTYAKWCSTKGFQYADKTIPVSWLNEPVNETSLGIVRELFAQQGEVCPI